MLEAIQFAGQILIGMLVTCVSTKRLQASCVASERHGKVNKPFLSIFFTHLVYETPPVRSASNLPECARRDLIPR